ncbi:MAG: hypothetical protein HYU39_06530 [Thaumarchaeota archaeon]|nr:hypothetical protein [Nitrososphaerota archaeon]
METEQAHRVIEELRSRGLYVANREAIGNLKEFGAQYSRAASLEEVRDITYRVWKKYKVTLSDEVKIMRRG